MYMLCMKALRYDFGKNLQEISFLNGMRCLGDE